MTTQAIVKTSRTVSFTFTGVPSEETRKALIAAGFTFDGRTSQWYKSVKDGTLVNEQDVANQLAA